MSEPFIGEIKLISFNFAPRGWAFSAGQLLPINQNQALFAVMGITYGGNGISNFALPDLRSRIPMHMGNGFALGQRDGEEAHTLLTAELPAHSHPVNAVANGAIGGTNLPSGAVELASAFTSQHPPQVSNLYSTSPPSNFLAPAAVGITGGDQPHENRMPFLVLNYVIALQGIFPTPN